MDELLEKIMENKDIEEGDKITLANLIKKINNNKPQFVKMTYNIVGNDFPQIEETRYCKVVPNKDICSCPVLMCGGEVSEHFVERYADKEANVYDTSLQSKCGFITHIYSVKKDT